MPGRSPVWLVGDAVGSSCFVTRYRPGFFFLIAHDAEVAPAYRSSAGTFIDVGTNATPASGFPFVPKSI